MMQFKDWLADVNGRYIDVDGWAGSQCWDLAQDLCTRVLDPAITLWTQPSAYPGYAIGSWLAYPVTNLKDHFERIPATEPAQPMDLAIWKWGAAHYPISHVAVVIRDEGSNLWCMSQNSSAPQPNAPGYDPDEPSGPAIRQMLTKDGLAGYLRHRTAVTNQAETIAVQEDPMPTLSDIATTIRNVLHEDRQKNLVRSLVGSAPIKQADGTYRPLAAVLQTITFRLQRTDANVIELKARLAAVTNAVADLQEDPAQALAKIHAAAEAGTAAALADAQKIDAELIASAVVDEQAERLTKGA